MSDFVMRNLMIVGFNGEPLVECGRALPVARRKSDGMHCVLQLPTRGEPWLGIPRTKPKRTRSRDAGPGSPSPSSCRKACVSESDGRLVRQPMVIFADEAMLDTADRLPHRTCTTMST